MNKLRPLFLALVVLLGGQSAAAAEAQTTISFPVDGQKVVGTLELPAGASRPGVILLLHGFKGTRNELEIPALKEGIFVRAANAWAAQGLASLRIDFRGGGDSDGSFEDTTISGQVKDALAAIGFLQTEKSIDSKKIALVGWSQGGAVAALTAGRTQHPVAAVALWNPETSPAATMASVLGPDAIREGLASAGRPVVIKLPWGGETSLKTAFFDDLFTVDPVAELARYSGPVFVAVGTKDPIIYPQPQSGQLFLTYHKGGGQLWVRPMDHVFNVFEETQTVDELIAATGAFVSKNFSIKPVR